MSDPNVPNPYDIRPPGAPPVGEEPIRIVDDQPFVPKTASDANSMHRTWGEVWRSRAVTIVGLGILVAVTISALLILLGVVAGGGERSHEDSMRLLLLVIGAVLAALYRPPPDRGE